MFTIFATKSSIMKNKTREDAAEAIIAAGAGKDDIVRVLEDVYQQGYNKGYRASTLDRRRAKEAGATARDKAFKNEMDIIDDVRQSKWQ